MTSSKCPICLSPYRAEIEAEKARGASVTEISTRAKLNHGIVLKGSAIRSHFRNHVDAVKHKAEPPKIETPETLEAIVSIMPSKMTVLESRIRTLESYIYALQNNQEATRWTEYEEGRTGTVTLSNRDVFKALIPNPDSIEKDKQKALSRVVISIQEKRGYAVDKEGVIAKKLEALHAQEREDEENNVELWIIQAREEEVRAEREAAEAAKSVIVIDKNPSAR